MEDTQQPHLEAVQEVLAQQQPRLVVLYGDHQAGPEDRPELSSSLLPAGQESPDSLYFLDQPEIVQDLVSSQLKISKMISTPRPEPDISNLIPQQFLVQGFGRISSKELTEPRHIVGLKADDEVWLCSGQNFQH